MLPKNETITRPPVIPTPDERPLCEVCGKPAALFPACVPGGVAWLWVFFGRYHPECHRLQLKYRPNGDER